MVLPTRAALAAVACIKWGSDVKPRLVVWVIANERDGVDVVEIPEKPTSDYTGVSTGAMHRAMRDLVDARVLFRVDGAGARGHAYAMNPELIEWRVPWLGVAISEPAFPVFREAAVRRVLDDFARPRVVQEGPIVPRSGAALARIVPRSGAAEYGPSAAQRRGTTWPLLPRTGAALAQRRAATPTSSSISSNNSLSLSAASSGARVTAGSEGVSESTSKNEELPTLLAAITMRTGRPVLGSLRGRLAGAIEGIDRADVVDLAERIAGGDLVTVKANVDLVEQYAHALRSGLGRGAGARDEGTRPRSTWDPDAERAALDAAAPPPAWLLERAKGRDGVAPVRDNGHHGVGATFDEPADEVDDVERNVREAWA